MLDCCKRVTFMIEGGIGKHIAFTALIPKLYKKYGTFHLVSAYPDVFLGWNEVDITADLGWLTRENIEQYVSKLIFREPYKGVFIVDFSRHLLDCWAEELGIKYDGELPLLKFDYREVPELRQQIEEIFSNVLKKPYIVLQVTGGQSPLGFREGSSYPETPMTLRRNYPFPLAVKLVQLLKKEFPDVTILDVCLPNEHPEIPNTVRVKVPYMGYVEIVRRAHLVIAIDSFIVHMATAVRHPRVIGLYGGCPAWRFGYSKNINLTNFSGDIRKFDEDNYYYICIDPYRILREVKKIWHD